MSEVETGMTVLCGPTDDGSKETPVTDADKDPTGVIDPRTKALDAATRDTVQRSRQMVDRLRTAEPPAWWPFGKAIGEAIARRRV